MNLKIKKNIFWKNFLGCNLLYLFHSPHFQHSLNFHFPKVCQQVLQSIRLPAFHWFHVFVCQKMVPNVPIVQDSKLVDILLYKFEPLLRTPRNSIRVFWTRWISPPTNLHSSIYPIRGTHTDRLDSWEYFQVLNALQTRMFFIYPYRSMSCILLPEYGSRATTFVANISVNWLYPSCASKRNVNGSPTAMVVVGRFWYRIINRTLELSVFSAGRYSIGIGLPDLSTSLKLL